MALQPVLIKHPRSNCVIPVDTEDAITLRAPGLTVGQAVPIVCNYAQPGSGLFITDETGLPRSLDEPLWIVQTGDTLHYRMDKLDVRKARETAEGFSEKYMKESEYSQILAAGHVFKRDLWGRKSHYVLLLIDLDERFFPDAVLNETLDAPPDGFPSFYRSPDRTFCIPIEYSVTSMMRLSW